MLEFWNRAALGLGDLFLGWLLWLPRGAAVVVAAIGTSLLLTLIRPRTTDQDLLARVAHDKRRLRERIRAAKQTGDRETLANLRAVQSAVALVGLRAEGWPLLASLLPIALLATWCFQRLEFHSPQNEVAIEVVLYLPTRTIGEPVHLVPQEGLSADGWIRRVEAQQVDDRVAGGVARWQVQGAASPQPYPLVFRQGAQTVEHELLVGQRRYASVVRTFDDAPEFACEVKLRPVKFLGIVPGFDGAAISVVRKIPGLRSLHLPPWLVAYLLIAILCAFLLKPLLGIH